jgi:uncharacterized protein
MQRIVISLLLLLVAGCADLDSNLFNTEELGAYSLPGNTIPDSLIEEVTMPSGGNTLYGYWVRSNGTRPGITFLYCHGNKHHIDEYWNRVMLLHATGANVFIFDFRGFGRSTGTSSEAGLKEDAEAALAYVRGRADVVADSIALYGYSLGNVASIHLAARRFDPLFLVAESPFASSTSLVQGSLALDLPARWLTDGTFDNASEVREIRTPLLLLHGSDDDFVRWRDNGRVVFENAPEPKWLELVEGANHTDIPERMGEDRYIGRITRMIDDVSGQ